MKCLLENLKKSFIFIVILLVLLLSSFGISGHLSNPESYKNTIEVLDEKREDALVISSAATAVAIGASAIPAIGEPVAELLTNIASYSVLITTIIFLEKFLLTTFGALTFKILIPVACVCGIVYLLSKIEFLKKLALKLTLFSLVLVAIIPLSARVSVYVEEIHKDSIISIEQIQEDNLEDKGFWDKFKDRAGDLKEYAEGKMNNFVDAIAVLLITTCAIPVGVFAFLMWIIKMLFGIDIKFPKAENLKWLLPKKKEQSE